MRDLSYWVWLKLCYMERITPSINSICNLIFWIHNQLNRNCCDSGNLNWLHIDNMWNPCDSIQVCNSHIQYGMQEISEQVKKTKTQEFMWFKIDLHPRKMKYDFIRTIWQQNQEQITTIQWLFYLSILTILITTIPWEFPMKNTQNSNLFSLNEIDHSYHFFRR